MPFHDSLNDIPDPEVVPTARPRTFTAAYKLRILEEADGCMEPGQVGACFHGSTSMVTARRISPVEFFRSRCMMCRKRCSLLLTRSLLMPER